MHQLEIIENDLKQLQAETKKKHGPLKEVYLIENSPSQNF